MAKNHHNVPAILSAQYLRKFLSVGLMMFALSFLTVSNIFLYPDSQGLVKKICKCELPEKPDKENGKSSTTNNANNMAEEKPESGNTNTLSEYLHTPHVMDHPEVNSYISHQKCHYEGKCLFTHSELFTPPPELS